MPALCHWSLDRSSVCQRDRFNLRNCGEWRCGLHGAHRRIHCRIHSDLFPSWERRARDNLTTISFERARRLVRGIDRLLENSLVEF